MSKKNGSVPEKFKVTIGAMVNSFSYLVREFAFDAPITTIIGYECSVTFRKSNRVAISVFCEAGGLPWVMMTGNVSAAGRYSAKTIALDYLLAHRCPQLKPHLESMFPVSQDHVTKLIQDYARALKECGSDVLDGSVAVFETA